MPKSLLYFVPLAALILLLGAYTFYIHAAPVHASTITQGPYLQNTASSTAYAVTSSTRLLATSTNALGNGTSRTRLYATICNPSATLVYVLMDGDKPASNTKANVVIGAAAGYSACFEINDRNPYNGSVTASSTGETSTSVIVTDYVY